MTPEPPFLIVRPGRSFWVQMSRADECSTTLQAFREGCFRDAWCYDATGGLWPIVEATLMETPSALQRLFAWRRVRVRLHLGPRAQVQPGEVVSRLAVVLLSDTSFTDSLAQEATQILRRFECARTPGEIIQIAREHA